MFTNLGKTAVEKQTEDGILEVRGIRSAIMSLLPEPSEFEDDDNLIERGLDSLRVMRLLSRWRKAGARVSFADLLEKPTLRNWLSLLNVKELPVEPETVAAESGPFPLTDIQYAYWIGRRDGQPLGGVGCHAYIEFDGRGIEPERLERAWRALLRSHPMLRARFGEDGRQEIMEEPCPDGFAVHDLRGSDVDMEGALEDVRARMSHRRLPVETGLVAGLELSLLPQGRTRLHFDVDLLVADAQSLKIMLRDLGTAYEQGKISAAPADWSFSGYLEREAARRKETEKQDHGYWWDRLLTMPGAPALPLAKKPEEVKCPRFRRRMRFVPDEQWRQLQGKAASYGVTPAMTLLTAYAEVLARWSETPHFLINMPLYNREVSEEGIENVIADFTNLVLLEVDFSAEAAFLERLRTLQNRFYKDVVHAGYSGVRVLRDLARVRPGENLCAPVVFAGNIGTRLLEEEGSPLGKPGYMISQTPQIWLDFQLYDTEGGLLLAWDAVEELFPSGMLDQMFAAYGKLIDHLADHGADWMTPFDFVPVPEGRRGEEGGELPWGPLHGPFFEAAGKSPGQTALISADGKTVSYGRLAETALRLASYLVESGVEAGDLVAVTLPRGELQVASALGVLAAGAAYTPVSPEQPPARRERIHRKAGIRYVLTDADLKAGLVWPDGAVVLDISRASDISLPEPRSVSPDALAYVIFTSGSTGEPKGVEITHAAAANTIAAVVRRHDLSEKDRGLGVSALDFDLSVFDIFGLLGIGASLVVPDEAARRNADVWLQLVAQHRVTVWNSVPILLDMLLTAADGMPGTLDSLRLALLSGDWIGLDLPSRLAAAAPQCRFAALGGATEASIWSNIQDVVLPLPATWQSIPYGRALPGQAYRVVDACGRDCPDWVPGELWIGGAGVARGYRGDPELSTRSFVLHKGMRWYRTGDLGRFWPDGTLEFLGRRDFQVKVRGHRIELGEIEACIKAFPGVRETAVTVFESARGIRRLRGFVVPASETQFEIPALRDFLREHLPEYMIPSVVSVLSALPLSANGKLDRKALAALHLPEDGEVEGGLPVTPLEKQLAGIWMELLSVPEIRLEDSFFELGGDSLLATRLVGEVRQAFGVKLPLDVLFLGPVFGEVASFINQAVLEKDAEPAAGDSSLPPLLPRKEKCFEPFPLTEIQHAYWIGRIGAYELGNVASHIYFEFDDLRLDLDRLREAWLCLVRRHDMLRAVFLSDGTQKILAETASTGFVVEDLRGRTLHETEEAVEAIRARMSTQVLPAESGPLFEIRAVRYDSPNGERTRLFLDFDALIADAWSLFLLLDEWLCLYRDSNAALPALEVSFRDYVLAEAALRTSEAYRADWEYWNARLDSIPMPPELPLAKNPVALTSARTRRRSIVLPRETWELLKSRIRQEGLSPSGFLIALYAEVLGMWSRSSRFTLNLTLFNRLPLHPQVNDLVGDFTSLNLLTVEGGQGTFLEKARTLQGQLWADMNHRLVDGIQVLRELGKRGRRLAPVVVFTGAVGLGTARDASALAEFGNLVASVTQTPQVCLDHQAYEQNGDLVLNWDAVEEMFPTGMLDAMFGAYCGLLRRLADGSGWEEEVLPDLPERQREARARFNATEAAFPEMTLDELFRRRASEFPDNVAVITPGASYTYAQLSIRADAVADALRGLGVRPNRLVAIVLEKGWDQIVAVVGVIRAGAAYLPIDPDVPAERLHLLLRAGEIEVALTSAALRETMPWPAEGVLPLAVDLLAEGAAPPPPVTAPEDIAYVIYTSGSTGLPKGVVIEHRSVVNTVLDINKRFDMDPGDRLFGLSGLHFDLSAYDIWGALAAGAALVLPQPSGLRDPSHWLPLIRRHGVTIWNSVPALMQMLMEYVSGAHSAPLDSLRLVLLSGDWIPLDLPNAVRRQASDADVVSLGGATEASIWSILYPIDRVDPAWKSIPYGYPMCNQTFHVLDENLRPRPDWVPGDLYIGGLGLAQGYWQDPERTAASFVVHPVSGERLYRTGDMGRFLPEGVIEFLGRDDFQVKLNGYRIELGEIETAFRAHAQVEEAIVVVAGANDTDRRLVAFAVGQGNLKSDDLLEFVRQRLPGYMVPSNVYQLEKFPLSANGKVDRGALGRMAAEAGAERIAVVPPVSRAEVLIVQAWEAVLGRQGVGVEDNFFDLGGTSVLAVRLHQGLVEAFGRSFPLVSIFEYPTIRAFVRFVETEEMPAEEHGEQDRIARRRARLGAGFSRKRAGNGTSNTRVPSNG